MNLTDRLGAWHWPFWLAVALVALMAVLLTESTVRRGCARLGVLAVVAAPVAALVPHGLWLPVTLGGVGVAWIVGSLLSARARAR